MKNKIGSYIKTIGIKSGEMIDVAGIKFDMYSLKRDRENKFLGIGKMVYKMFLKDKLDQKKLFDECKDILELEKQIKQREEQIKKIHESVDKTLKKHAGKDYKEGKKKSKDGHVEADDSDGES